MDAARLFATGAGGAKGVGIGCGGVWGAAGAAGAGAACFLRMGGGRLAVGAPAQVLGGALGGTMTACHSAAGGVFVLRSQCPHAQGEAQGEVEPLERHQVPDIGVSIGYLPKSMMKKVIQKVQKLLESPNWRSVAVLLLFVGSSVLGYYAYKGSEKAKFIVDVLDKANKAYKPLLELFTLVSKILLAIVKTLGRGDGAAGGGVKYIWKLKRFEVDVTGYS
ncbi:hypothetical protein ACP70R_007089 [Stipagrostis hirtigluma subsp. patula]